MSIYKSRVERESAGKEAFASVQSPAALVTLNRKYFGGFPAGEKGGFLRQTEGNSISVSVYFRLTRRHRSKNTPSTLFAAVISGHPLPPR